MGYYKDTGSLQSMASAETILKKRMPEKVGILPVAELLFGETLADINGRSKYYEGFSRCVDRKPEEGAWIEPTEFGMMFLSILDLGMSEEEAEKIGIPITQTWKRISRSRY